jgi:hypothetical protein
MSPDKSTAAVQLTTAAVGSLVLEQLPSGEWAWLRPELDAVIHDADRLDQAAHRLLDRCALTEQGRDYLIAVLQAAAGKCLGGTDTSSQDLLEVAEAFERWLLEPEAGTT